MEEKPGKSPDPLISQRGDNSCCRRQVSLCQSRGRSRSSPGLGWGPHPACSAQAGSCREQRGAAGPLIPGLTQGTHMSVKERNRKTNALKQPLRFYPATCQPDKPNTALCGEKPQNKTSGVWMPRARDRTSAVTVTARNLPQQELCCEHGGCSSRAPGHLLPHGATAWRGPCPPGVPVTDRLRRGGGCRTPAGSTAGAVAGIRCTQGFCQCSCFAGSDGNLRRTRALCCCVRQRGDFVNLIS